MISVIRTPKPSLLASNETLWRAALDRATDKREQKKARDKYRQPEIRQALKRMFQGKCAYCESRFAHTSYGHIEHFRPKSRFPELTFEWENLLWACGVCNSTENKGDHFPEDENGGLLLDPCEDDPTLHLRFVYDDVREEAKIEAKTERGRTTIALLGLNRRALLDYRTERLQNLFVLAELASVNPKARKLLSEAVEDRAEYAAFARALLAVL